MRSGSYFYVYFENLFYFIILRIIMTHDGSLVILNYAKKDCNKKRKGMMESLRRMMQLWNKLSFFHLLLCYPKYRIIFQ